MFGKKLHLQREGLEVIYQAQGMLEAEAVKGRLETSGIPAALDYESIGRTFGLTIDGLGEVRILVSIERAAEARELLRISADDPNDEAEFEPANDA
ncbi:MAG: DUF2007 domain-containing protein [Thermoflexales bacterium]|nr:DUF2007 domain-containing protein [Thermoflexales bacterium]